MTRKPRHLSRTPQSTRRPKGVIDTEVLAYLQAHPDTDHGPYLVARAINARTGAVHPSLDRLVARNLVIKTQEERPVRYRIAKAGARPPSDAEAVVLAFLRDHRTDVFTAYQVAQSTGISQGTCYIAVKRLMSNSRITLVSEKPARYQYPRNRK